MTFYLGKGSRENLKGVHPRLVRCVEDAILLTPVDFTILNNGGLRSASMQKALFKRGASTLDGYNKKSKHQKQESGYGEAVDLVPYYKGSARWEWPLIYPIAAAMAITSQRSGVALRWGGVWDRNMNDYVGASTNDLNDIALRMKDEVRRYTIRHPGPDFIDGPHYEMT